MATKTAKIADPEADEESMPIVVKRKWGTRTMVSWRIPDELLKEVERICDKEGVDRTQLFLAWLQMGIEDYRKHGLTTVD